MDPTVLDLLLEDAREQYKAELDRAGQVFTRCGIYLAVLTLYVGALTRFFDKPPVQNSQIAVGIFLASGAVLVLATAFGLCFTVCALWGRSVTYTLLPGDWISHVEQLAPWYREAAEAGRPSDETLEQDVKEKMLLRFAESTKNNFLIRTKRFGYCHLATQALALGLLCLLLSAGSYSYLIVRTPVSSPVALVRVVDPIELREYIRDMSNQGNRGGSGGGTTNASGRPEPRPTSTAPANQLRPKPEPRPVRTVKDGEVRSGHLLND